MKDIKDVCASFTSHINFDLNFAKLLEEFRIQWGYKSDEYIDFLASNLVGVHKIRFSAKDEDALYYDVLEIDYSALEYEIHRTPGINKQWKVSSNPTLIILMYLCHKYMNSNLPNDKKEYIVTNIYLIFAFKILGSLYSNYFKFYQVDPAIAKVVYEKLSNKFLLKRLPNWQAVLEYRARDLFENGSENKKRVLRFTTDDCIKLVNDLQSRLRDMVKNIFLLIKQVEESGEKVTSTSLIEIDSEEGGERIKESSNDAVNYIRFINNVISSSSDFVQSDLIELLRDKKLFPKLEANRMSIVLTHISEQKNLTIKKNISILEYLITDALRYLSTKGISNDLKSQLYDVLLKLKAYWSSSSVKDPNLKEIKAWLGKNTTAAIGLRNTGTVSMYVIATMVYIFIRAFRMDKV